MYFKKKNLLFPYCRSYEDVKRNNIEGQTYNTMDKGTNDATMEQIYDDVKYWFKERERSPHHPTLTGNQHYHTKNAI